MFNDSSVTEVGLKRPGREMGGSPLECTFWTRADGQLSVQFFRTLTDVVYQPHTHSEYGITVCLDGKIVRTQFNQTRAARAGEVVISNSGIVHGSTYLVNGSASCEAVGVAFDRRLLATLARELSLPAVSGNTCLAFDGSFGNDIILRCAQEIAQELRRRGAGHKLILEALGMRLLGETLRAWPRNQVTLANTDPTARLSQRDFIRAYEFMRSCRKEAFRVEHLCNFLGSSEENFTRLFSASTNHPPASFYNQLLLQRARELLDNSRLSIKEISFELGFKTSSHFIAAFGREFDVSPQKYRDQANPAVMVLNS